VPERRGHPSRAAGRHQHRSERRSAPPGAPPCPASISRRRASACRRLPSNPGMPASTRWYGSSDLLVRLLEPAGTTPRICWYGSSDLLVRLLGSAGTAPRTCWYSSSDLLVQLLGLAGMAPRTCWYGSSELLVQLPGIADTIPGRLGGAGRVPGPLDSRAGRLGRAPGALAQLHGDTTVLSGSPEPARTAASSAVVLRLSDRHPHWR
jgi:hypothetical protein